MSEEKAKGASSNADKELADLLDSALNDFNSESSKEKSDEKKEETETAEGGEGEEWTDEMIKQAASQFEANLAAMLGNIQGEPVSENQIEDSFKKMAEAAQQVLANPAEVTDTGNDFARTITQTLQGLSDGSNAVQNPFSEQDIMSMFNPAGAGAGGGVGAAQGDSNVFLPFMQGMMQSLLSKEVLYPSLKDILDKFPGWLQENESKISAEDKERYNKQKDLMQDVCNELETETATDSADVKRNRFEKVLGLMQKLQDYGQPPTDLVGEEVMPFDQIPAMKNPDQCSLM